MTTPTPRPPTPEPPTSERAPAWPPPTGSPAGTTGWYLASDGVWYRSDDPPAPGYRLAGDGRWAPAGAGEAWRSSRWGLGDVWWGVLVYLAGSIAAGFAVALVIASGDGGFDDVEFGAYGIAVLVLVNVLAFFGVPWLASRRKGLASLRADFGLWFRPRDLAIGLGMGLAGVLGAGIVGTSIDRAFGLEENTSNVPVDELTGAAEIVVFAIAVAIVTPVIEELFFRGLLYRSFLKRGRSARATIVLTTIAFVVPHLGAATDLASVTSLAASIGVLGLAFALAYHLTGNRLGAPIVAHVVVNGLAVLALALG